MGLLKEFKDFAVKGNALDMAVGIIIGAAFGKIVNSLVNDIIMPPIGMLLGGKEFQDLAWTLKAAVTGADETNLVVTSLARFEFGVPRTIARVKNPRNAWMFTAEMGVDVALNQADLLAHLIAEEMSLGDMMTLLKLRKGRFSLVEEKVHPEAPGAGMALRDLALPEECVLVAVLRKGQLLLPRGEVVLHPADEVLALVHASQAARLAAVLGRGGP